MMCCYLNVQFQGQRVNALKEALTWALTALSSSGGNKLTGK